MLATVPEYTFLALVKLRSILQVHSAFNLTFYKKIPNPFFEGILSYMKFKTVN
jgi:hypothetical protein